MKIYIILICLIITEITSLPLQEVTTIQNTSAQEYNESKSIEEIVKQQTETVKAIVKQQEQNNLDSIILSKQKIAQAQKKLTKNDSNLSIEELRAKCEQLQKLLNNKNNKNDIENSDNVETEKEETKNVLSSYPQSVTNLPYGYSSNLPYNRFKVSGYQHRNMPSQLNLYKSEYTYKPSMSGFYVTTEVTSTTPKNVEISTTPNPKKSINNVKYIRLEPVILQKTFLGDGRVVYYWHKSLPTSIHYPQKQHISSKRIDELPMTQFITTTPKIVTTEPPTTTTTSSGFFLRNLFPTFYSSIDYKKPTSTTTTPKPPPTTEKVNNYPQQLRFVVPVPMENEDSYTVKQPYEFDQFSYYPKELHAHTVNVQVPYAPSFPVIKAVDIPGQFKEQQHQRENYDNMYELYNVNLK